MVTGYDGHTFYGLILQKKMQKIIFKKDRPPKEGGSSRYQSASSSEQSE